MTRWQHFLIALGWMDEPAPASIPRTRVTIDGQKQPGGGHLLDIVFDPVNAPLEVLWFGSLRVDRNGVPRNKLLEPGDNYTIISPKETT